MSTGKTSHKIFAIVMLILIVGSTIGIFVSASYSLFDYVQSQSETSEESESAA